jgi:hypothetical protein
MALGHLPAAARRIGVGRRQSHTVLAREMRAHVLRIPIAPVALVMWSHPAGPDGDAPCPGAGHDPAQRPTSIAAFSAGRRPPVRCASTGRAAGSSTASRSGAQRDVVAASGESGVLVWDLQQITRTSVEFPPSRS